MTFKVEIAKYKLNNKNQRKVKVSNLSNKLGKRETIHH